ncbi:LysR substrate-binding domain-containing protein [Vibrio sp. YMD68]|uniref:LysR substrate-binding domain-containing protein n=1 Tax=Vibrio sp. YMD68 TaxID=3042300 RepID=UPI00249B32D5|nr:LysR substrate-binding domain-containing protein [Vibrio sp. YMD68]WGV99433.1 LysR substrate-binding domain-containing protein [Vibrio sp. YMD68]
MRYSLKQLAVFDAVAELGSVSQAAERLSITQSAASMSLSQLEKLLGRDLFVRQGKDMRLSHWGNWLRPKAKRLLQDAEQIELGFFDQHLFSGSINIGASQTPAEHLVPELISKIDNDFPEIRVGLEVRSTHRVIQGVLNYQYDIGIIEGRCDDNRTHQEEWCRDHLVVVSSAHHPYAKNKRVSLSQLEQAKWVLREGGAGTREIFESAMVPLIPDLDVWREHSYVPVIRTMVANGQYLSCLPYLDVAPSIERGELAALNVPELKMDRAISFIWRADVGDHPLLECLKREGHRMIKNSKTVER